MEKYKIGRKNSTYFFFWKPCRAFVDNFGQFLKLEAGVFRLQEWMQQLTTTKTVEKWISAFLGGKKIFF